MIQFHVVDMLGDDRIFPNPRQLTCRILTLLYQLLNYLHILLVLLYHLISTIYGFFFKDCGSMLIEDTEPLPEHPTAPFVALEHANDGKRHLLLAASGSVATIKLPLILKGLSHYNDLSIRVVVTKAAENFLAGQSEEQLTLSSLAKIRNVDGIYRDEDEWIKPWVRGAGILHIELRRWNDILVIAPLSANTMAKMSVGIADNLLLSVVRAWDTTGEIDGGVVKRIIVALAMNTAMWRHPITKSQLHTLEEGWGVGGDANGWIEVLRPVEKTLACGDIGDGAMREWDEIVAVIAERLNLKKKG